MNKKLFCLLTVMIGVILTSDIALGANPFYEGKTIRIIVGLSPGGGFDTYARVIARHMGKHIPGNPTIFVENMAGAGGVIAANHLYKIAKPDGLTIGHIPGTLFLNQVFKQPGIEFDARKFEFIGAPATQDYVFAFRKSSGITSLEKWMSSKAPIKMGGQSPGNGIDSAIRIAKTVLGLPTQLVSGYKGTSDIRLAVESGEIAGTSWGWSSMKVAWRNALATGDIVIVLQAVPKPLPDFPNVPLAINLAKTDEARQLIEVGLHSPGIMDRPYILPPGTPKERWEILVKAFQETLRDKELIAETEKAKLDLSPIPAEELTERVAEIFKLNPALTAKLEEIFYK